MRIILFVFTLCVALLLPTRSVAQDLYSIVSDALIGKVTIDEAQYVVEKVPSLNVPRNGKTPIYLLLDVIATTRKDSCKVAETLLFAFAKRSDFDANTRYRSLLPPLAYLIRTNYAYLGNRFDEKYISTKVIETLINKGATINSYNTDGTSLMAFARATKNEELQQFLIHGNIDLGHVAQSGLSEIDNILDDGNFVLLQQVIAKNPNIINVSVIRSDLVKLRAKKEMYDYLAKHCADQVSNYDELMLYMQKFSDKKDVIRGKYEQMVQKELALASSFDDVMNVADRYKETLAIVEDRKRWYYSIDCKQVSEIYEQALSQIRNGGSELIDTSDICVRFIKRYAETYRYDPECQLAMARTVDDYIAVTKSLQLSLTHKYWRIAEAGVLETFLLQAATGTPYSYYFEKDRALLDQNLMKRSVSIVNADSHVKEFQAYYHTIKVRVEKRFEQFQAGLREQLLAYTKAQGKIDRALQSMAEEQYAQNKREKEMKRLQAMEIERLDTEVEAMRVPHYSVFHEWEEYLSLGGIVDAITRNSIDQRMTVKFKNGNYGTIGRNVKERNYVAMSSGEWYTNLSDAITAEYVYLVYDRKIRQKGRIK